MAKSSNNKPPGKGKAVKKTGPSFVAQNIESAQMPGIMEPINHIPYVDIFSTGNNVVIEVEMPGVRFEDIDVTIFENTLNIKADKYECFEEKNINYICMERTYGKIFRAVEIPVPVNTRHIEANYTNGILKITIPIVEDKRGKPRHVPIKSS
jgi:HSP20 family protein